MKQLKHLKYGLATCLKKHPETLETQHRHAAMTYLVGNCGGAGLLDGARPHTPAMAAIGRGRGDIAGSGEGAYG
jgi:hypothetical protein